MTGINLEVHYIGSYPDVAKCPDMGLPEYCFIGRSNVGKSSMINYITGLREIARTSKKPGKTQSINLFKVIENPEWIIADLPGYGYARVARSTRKTWSALIDRYLLNRPNLMCTFLLLDIRHPGQENDIAFMRFLGRNAIPFCILYTKSDKLKPEALHQALESYERTILEEWELMPPSFVTSSILPLGKEEILRYIRQMNTIFTKQVPGQGK